MPSGPGDLSVFNGQHFACYHKYDSFHQNHKHLLNLVGNMSDFDSGNSVNCVLLDVILYETKREK